MRESGWYPPGAEFDPSAAYNEVGQEQEEREFKVEAVFELRRKDTILTDDYDDEGIYDVADTWKSQHITPLELIAECKRLAEDLVVLLQDIDPDGRALRHLERAISECEGWVVSYSEFN